MGEGRGKGGGREASGDELIEFEKVDLRPVGLAIKILDTVCL